MLGHKLKVNLVFGGCCGAFTFTVSAHLGPDGVRGCYPNSVPNLIINDLTSSVGMADRCRTKVFNVSLSSCFQHETCRRTYVLENDDKLVLQ